MDFLVDFKPYLGSWSEKKLRWRRSNNPISVWGGGISGRGLLDGCHGVLRQRGPHSGLLLHCRPVQRWLLALPWCGVWPKHGCRSYLLLWFRLICSLRFAYVIEQDKGYNSVLPKWINKVSRKCTKSLPGDLSNVSWWQLSLIDKKITRNTQKIKIADLTSANPLDNVLMYCESDILKVVAPHYFLLSFVFLQRGRFFPTSFDFGREWWGQRCSEFGVRRDSTGTTPQNICVENFWNGSLSKKCTLWSVSLSAR